MNDKNQTFRHISPTDARQRLAADSIALVDIRDPLSHAQGHIIDTVHLNDENVGAYLKGADRQRPLVVYCYHGNSSQLAAQFFVEQGFEEVYSLDGGFDEWARLYPETCRSADGR
jgi:thiosulfate sulfurtransferase